MTDLIGGLVLVALGISIIVLTRIEVLWANTLEPVGRFFYLTIARAQASAEVRPNESISDAAARLMVEARQWNAYLGILFMLLGVAFIAARVV